MLLKLGSRGNEVKNLQSALKFLGYPIAVDSIFGEGTKDIVEMFQRDNSLSDDGVVGNKTWKKLKWESENQEIYEYNDEGTQWRLVNTDIPHHFEGCKLKAYLCPAKVWTCGWGSTGPHVNKYTIWTQEAADVQFYLDMQRFVDNLNNVVTVPLTQNKVDALLSFMFNIGCSAFNKSTLLRKLNKLDYLGSADELLRWNKGGGKVLKGLDRRRKSERHMFLTGEVKLDF